MTDQTEAQAEAWDNCVESFAASLPVDRKSRRLVEIAREANPYRDVLATEPLTPHAYVPGPRGGHAYCYHPVNRRGLSEPCGRHETLSVHDVGPK